MHRWFLEKQHNISCDVNDISSYATADTESYFDLLGLISAFGVTGSYLRKHVPSGIF